MERGFDSSWRTETMVDDFSALLSPAGKRKMRRELLAGKKKTPQRLTGAIQKQVCVFSMASRVGFGLLLEEIVL